MGKIYCETQDGQQQLLNAKTLTLRVSAYGILLSGGTVLVTKTYLPLWEFPGGAVEKGESLLQALRREFKEETGLEIKVKEFIAERECFYCSPTGRIFHSFQHFFLVTRRKKDNGLSAHSTKNHMIQWIPLSTVSSKNMKRSAFDIFSLLTKKNVKEGKFLTTLQ